MDSQKKHQEQYDIELPQSIVDSFARFLVPEIRKLYTSEEGQKELEEWKKKYSEKNEEWSGNRQTRCSERGNSWCCSLFYALDTIIFYSIIYYNYKLKTYKIL